MNLRPVVHVLAVMLFVSWSCPSLAQDIQWSSTEVDLGSVTVMEDNTCSFTFLNATSSPVVVETVRTSCGCTEPQWPMEPVLPGQTSQITITFTPNRAGYHRKKIRVFFTGIRKGTVLWIEAQAE